METYVITEPCIGVKDGSCVDVCPVACIHTTPDSPQYYIDPEICIECEQCVVVCPVDAIFLDEDLPPKWNEYLEINAQFFAANQMAAESMTPERATEFVNVACNYAESIGVAVAIVVVDHEGKVILAREMVGTEPSAAESALARAQKSVVSGRRDIGALVITNAALTELIGVVAVAGAGNEDDAKVVVASQELQPH